MFETFPYPFGPYQLLEKIGQGGMAEIFRAKQQGAQDFVKEVAIKRILSSLASNEDFVTQFLDEARIAGSLSHPNIVQIFNVGQVENAYYIAMEYVHGRHLGQVIRSSIESQQLFPIHVAASIAKEVAQALSFAHSARDSMGTPLNIIHRDISPQNILVDFHGSVKLTDFGIAKAANKLFQTTAGVIKGKFSYLAPEQLIGKPASPASDLFSLGIVFWEMLSGRRLFQGESDIKTIQMVQACEIPPITQFRSDLPSDLDDILRNLLASSPQYRYQEASMLVQDLSYFLNNNGYSEGPSQISNFMGSLYPEHFPRTVSPPTKASLPALSMEDLNHNLQENAQPSEHSSSALEDFEDAITPVATHVELSDASSEDWQNKEPIHSPEDFDDVHTAAVDMSPLLNSTAFQEQKAQELPDAVLQKLENMDGGFEETIGSEDELKGEDTYPVQSIETNDMKKMLEPLSSSSTVAERPQKSKSSKAFIGIVSVLSLLLVGLAAVYIFVIQNKKPSYTVRVTPPKRVLVTLKVITQPKVAQVTLNGHPIKGQKGIYTETGLRSGLSYRLHIQRNGYSPIRRKILLKKALEEIHIHLKKKP